MVSISNSDRDRMVEYLKEYREILAQEKAKTSKAHNRWRMLNNLVRKISKKPVENRPNRKK